MKRSLFALGALIVCLALQADSSVGREAADEKLDAKLLDDAAVVMKSVWSLREKECGLGAEPAAAGATMKRAAGYYFEYVIALTKSPFAAGERAGVVAFDLVAETGHVDEVRISILTGRYDEKALTARLIATARELGVALEPDGDRARCWTSAGDESVADWLCFSLGDGVVRVEASR